jgi:hypothetical protein
MALGLHRLVQYEKHNPDVTCAGQPPTVRRDAPGLCCKLAKFLLFEDTRKDAFALGLREPLDGIAQRRSWYRSIVLL